MPGNALTTLRPRQARAVLALLAEPTIAKAAASVSINEKTLRRWLATPSFRAAIDEARREAYGEVMSRLQAASGRALDALLDVLDDAKARPSDRVASAKALLDHGHRVEESLDLRARVAGLQAQVGHLEKHGTVPAGCVLVRWDDAINAEGEWLDAEYEAIDWDVLDEEQAAAQGFSPRS